jgi:hypothetical protein
MDLTYAKSLDIILKSLDINKDRPITVLALLGYLEKNFGIKEDETNMLIDELYFKGMIEPAPTQTGWKLTFPGKNFLREFDGKGFELQAIEAKTNRKSLNKIPFFKRKILRIRIYELIIILGVIATLLAYLGITPKQAWNYIKAPFVSSTPAQSPIEPKALPQLQQSKK